MIKMSALSVKHDNSPVTKGTAPLEVSISYLQIQTKPALSTRTVSLDFVCQRSLRNRRSTRSPRVVNRLIAEPTGQFETKRCGSLYASFFLHQGMLCTVDLPIQSNLVNSTVRGAVFPEGWAFYSVPFAKPPVGDLRLRSCVMIKKLLQYA